MAKRIRIIIVITIGVVLIAGLLWRNASRQEAPKHYRIAVVSRKGAAIYDEGIANYKKKMSDLGYVEGGNLTYDMREFTDSAELANIIRDVITQHPDLIHTYSTPATVEAYKQTKDMPSPIPVVFGSVGDPLAAGIVKGIEYPGTNVTGIASLSTELTGNQLRYLKEIKPSVSRVGMPYSAPELNDAAAKKSVEIAQKTASTLGITLILYPVKSKEENASVARTITKKDVDGIIIGGDSLIWGSIKEYIDQAIREKIPMTAFDSTQVKSGAIVGIGPDYSAVGKQAAIISHKILQGSSPGQIAVQVPEKFILSVNLETARAIGLPIPDEFFKGADVVIGKDSYQKQ